jgi:hypothetical protein
MAFTYRLPDKRYLKSDCLRNNFRRAVNFQAEKEGEKDAEEQRKRRTGNGKRVGFDTNFDEHSAFCSGRRANLVGAINSFKGQSAKRTFARVLFVRGGK